MHESEATYLIHSAKGTNWTKKAHKYISRVWKKGKWVYEYPITGKGYLKRYNRAEDSMYEHRHQNFRDSLDYRTKMGKDGTNSRDIEAYNKAVKQMENANADYQNKSLVGKGKSIVDNLLTEFDIALENIRR